MIASILTAGTLNLMRLAACIDSAAQIASVHPRLGRFFSDVQLNEADVARLVVAASSLVAEPWHLAIDRTNGQFGKTDLHLLVLSVAHGDVCVPLFCRVLDKAGNFNTAERIDLMQVFEATFSDQAVASLTDDRKFRKRLDRMAATGYSTAFSARARSHACVQRQPCPVAIAPA